MPTKEEKRLSKTEINPSFWDNLLQEEFNKETDRGAVILAATLFDITLDSLLRIYLVPISTGNEVPRLKQRGILVV
jgi:hypothetical protein